MKNLLRLSSGFIRDWMVSTVPSKDLRLLIVQLLAWLFLAKGLKCPMLKGRGCVQGLMAIPDFISSSKDVYKLRGVSVYRSDLM